MHDETHITKSLDGEIRLATTQCTSAPTFISGTVKSKGDCNYRRFCLLSHRDACFITHQDRALRVCNVCTVCAVFLIREIGLHGAHTRARQKSRLAEKDFYRFIFGE